MKFLFRFLILFLCFLFSCSTLIAKDSQSNENANKIEFKENSFSQLANWNSANQLKSFNAFKKSCQKELEDEADKPSNLINVCKKAVNKKIKNIAEAREFFEKNFNLYQVISNKKDTGVFTGYYEPIIKGSLVKTAVYSVPIYSTPDNLVKISVGKDKYKFGCYSNGKFVPYYTREEISKGNLFSRKDVLVWVKSKIERAFLQIQGSGIIRADKGDISLGYDSQNGHSYKPIGKYLLDHDYMSLKEMSMQSIKQWLYKHKDKVEDVLNYDPSFVFFKDQNAKNAIGAEGVELTPKYSLAIDNDYYSYGTPMWLETSYYKNNPKTKEPFNRLMIAQDTGGAIKGAIRGDVFWGHGKQAEFNAGYMNNKGKLWVLLPKENK